MARYVDRDQFEKGLAGLAAGWTSVEIDSSGLRDAEAVRLAEGVKASGTLTELWLGSECVAGGVGPSSRAGL